MFKSSTARIDADSSRGVLLPPDLQLTLYCSQPMTHCTTSRAAVSWSTEGREVGKEGFVFKSFSFTYNSFPFNSLKIILTKLCKFVCVCIYIYTHTHTHSVYKHTAFWRSLGKEFQCQGDGLVIAPNNGEINWVSILCFLIFTYDEKGKINIRCSGQQAIKLTK